MSRIRMQSTKREENNLTFREAFKEFTLDAAARGLSPKTLRTYDNHFHCISRHFNVS